MKRKEAALQQPIDQVFGTLNDTWISALEGRCEDGPQFILGKAYGPTIRVAVDQVRRALQDGRGACSIDDIVLEARGHAHKGELNRS